MHMLELFINVYKCTLCISTGSLARNMYCNK